MPRILPGFVFVHIPKTGGNWTRQAVGGLHRGNVHGPYYQIPWTLPGRRVVTQIRDPWSWYGSLWLHMRAVGWELPGATLAECVHAWTDLSGAGEGWPIPEMLQPYGPGPHPPLKGGLWSWVYEMHLRDNPALMIDLAQVSAGWLQLGVPVVPRPPANVRGSWDYEHLYTGPMRARVARADRRLVDLCGYRFLTPAARAVTAWSR